MLLTDTPILYASVSANDFPFINDINIDNADLSCDTINYCLKLSTVISQTCCCRYHMATALYRFQFCVVNLLFDFQRNFFIRFM